MGIENGGYAGGDTDPMARQLNVQKKVSSGTLKVFCIGRMAQQLNIQMEVRNGVCEGCVTGLVDQLWIGLKGVRNGVYMVNIIERMDRRLSIPTEIISGTLRTNEFPSPRWNNRFLSYT
jgi:hypothetical protein